MKIDELKIKSLGKTPIDAICRAFSLAFADYEVQLDNRQLQNMLKRRGFDPNLSFAAFDKNDIVAFTLNGIGIFNKVPTAYDTGTGTVKEYRGQGLATKIFKHSLPYLKKEKIEQYLLEVLQHNTNAVSVYRNLGFEVSREFNYFISKNKTIDSEIKNSEFACSIKQIDIERFKDSIPNFWDFYPSWQNSFESVRRAADGFISLGAFAGERLAGYCIFEPASGDVTQIAVDKQYRRNKIATSLLHEIVNLNKNDAIKFLNTAVPCDSITSFLKAKNINITGKQFEMTRGI